VKYESRQLGGCYVKGRRGDIVNLDWSCGEKRIAVVFKIIRIFRKDFLVGECLRLWLGEFVEVVVQNFRM
jgi:hypothetical protein